MGKKNISAKSQSIGKRNNRDWHFVQRCQCSACKKKTPHAKVSIDGMTSVAKCQWCGNLTSL